MYIKAIVAGLLSWILSFSVLTVTGQTYRLVPADADTTQMRLEVEDISIVSRKEGQSIREIPTASSYVMSRDLNLSKIDNIRDFSLMIPNLFIPDYGTKLNTSVYIRGIGSRNNSPSVGLYVDGIPFFEKSAFDFDFSEISHIEVLRGPQGTLYGRNTMGGIINVSTKSPLTNKGTQAQVSYGNYNQIQASLSHYGTITPKFGYSLSGNYRHNDGFFTNEYDGGKADRLDAGGGRLRLRYKNRGWDVNLVGNYEYSDQGGYPYGKLNPATLEPEPVNYNRSSFYRRRLSANGLIVNHTGENVMYTSRTSHQYTSDHQAIDQDFSPRDRYYINQRETMNMVSQEFGVRSVKNSRITWIGGVFGFYQSQRTQVTMDYLHEAVPPDMTTDKFYRSPRYGYAVFGQLTFNRLFTDGLSLTAGARYDQEFARTTFDYYRIFEGETSLADRFKSRLNHRQVSPKVSLQYAFPRGAMLYAAVTKGYKAGGFNTSFITEDERSFKPEHSWNYEIGAKTNFFDNRLSTDIALFYINWTDLQVYQPLSTGTGSLYRNAARAVSKGVEVSALWRIVRNLNLGADYGYTHATFKNYTVGNKGNFSGNYLPYVPRNTLSVRLDYVLSSFRCKYYDRMIFGVQYSGVGKLYWNDGNTVPQKFYNTLNAKIAITKDIVTLAVWMKNITSTRYSAFYFEALGSSFVQKGRPLTVGVDVAVAF